MKFIYKSIILSYFLMCGHLAQTSLAMDSFNTIIDEWIDPQLETKKQEVLKVLDELNKK